MATLQSSPFVAKRRKRITLEQVSDPCSRVFVRVLTLSTHETCFPPRLFLTLNKTLIAGSEQHSPRTKIEEEEKTEGKEAEPAQLEPVADVGSSNSPGSAQILDGTESSDEEMTYEEQRAVQIEVQDCLVVKSVGFAKPSPKSVGFAKPSPPAGSMNVLEQQMEALFDPEETEEKIDKSGESEAEEEASVLSDESDDSMFSSDPKVVVAWVYQ